GVRETDPVQLAPPIVILVRRVVERRCEGIAGEAVEGVAQALQNENVAAILGRQVDARKGEEVQAGFANTLALSEVVDQIAQRRRRLLPRRLGKRTQVRIDDFGDELTAPD